MIHKTLFLLTAEKIDIDQVLRDNVPHRAEDKTPAWQSAMAAAFESAKLDTYSSQRNALDRRVLIRYHVGDPALIAELGWRWFYGLPPYGVSDARGYAELVLASAQVLEAQGDTRAASQKYLAIAHFGQLLSPDVSAWFCEDTQQAYTRLAALAAKSSRPRKLLFMPSLQIGSVKPRHRNLPDTEDSWAIR